MQEIYIENAAEVFKNKARLEKELKVKFSNRGQNIFVNGKAEAEFIALEVLEAIKNGFSADRALKLKQEGMMFQRVDIKDITKRNDLERVRGRIIGKSGGTLKTLNNLTHCDLSLHDNEIGIIGDAEEIEDAIQAVTSIVQGSKQSNIYARLEKRRKSKRLTESLPIKNELRKKS
jgi:KH domain-containing protein